MSVDVALVTQFSDRVHIEAQQGKSRTRPLVEFLPMSGDEMAYDGLGSIEATEIIGRVQPKVFTEIEHLRRKISRRRFSVNLPIDEMDVKGMLQNPSSRYPKAVAKAMERQLDHVVIECLDADVYTGRNFGTTVTAATDGVITVDATAGLTYAKLLEIKQNFLNKEVGTEVGVTKTLLISGDEHTALMNTSQLTSGDYSRQYVVDKGEIIKAVGLDIVVFGASVNNPMLAVSGGVRSNFCVTSDAVAVGMSKNMEISIDKRVDYEGVTQVSIVGIFGAVRKEGVQVQKVNTTD